MISKKNFNHQNGWSFDIKALSNVLILNKANWYLAGCNESRSQLKAKPQPRRKLMKPGTEAYLVYVSPSIQRHGTLTRSVLLNTWPVNNYMKEQSVRERATGRVSLPRVNCILSYIHICQVWCTHAYARIISFFFLVRYLLSPPILLFAMYSPWLKLLETVLVERCLWSCLWE